MNSLIKICPKCKKHTKYTSSKYNRFLNSINILNPSNDFKCELKLNNHTKKLRAIAELENKNIVSCSKDNTIKIWSIDETSYTLIRTIEGIYPKNTKENFCRILALSKNRVLIKRIKI